MNLFRFLFPPISEVKPGTLWLANRPLIEGKYSFSDLIQVTDIFRCGLVRAEVIPIKAERKGLSHPIHFPRDSTYQTKYQIAREHHIITEEQAKQLGFQI